MQQAFFVKERFIIMTNSADTPNNPQENIDFAEIKKEWDKIVSNPEKLKCTCHITSCNYHGNCKKCITLHKHFGNFPNCMSHIAEKLKFEAA